MEQFTFSPASQTVTAAEIVTYVPEFEAVYTGPPRHTVSGRLVTEDGVGLPLIFTLSHRAVSNYRNIRLISQSDGTFVSPPVPDGRYGIYLSSGYAGPDYDFHVAGADTSLGDIAFPCEGFPTDYDVTVSVTDSDGLPVEGATVVLSNNLKQPVNVHHTFIDIGDGLYKTWGVRVYSLGSPKLFTLTVEKPGYAFVPVEQVADLHWQRNILEATLALDPITGTQHDAALFFPLGPGARLEFETAGESDPGDSLELASPNRMPERGVFPRSSPVTSPRIGPRTTVCTRPGSTVSRSCSALLARVRVRRGRWRPMRACTP